mgnify:CR=1 FL=1
MKTIRHYYNKAWIYSLVGIMCLFSGCEKDPGIDRGGDANEQTIENTFYSFKKLSNCKWCFLLPGANEGLVIETRAKYNRLVDSINFDEIPYKHCDKRDFQRGWDFGKYTYLFKRATVGGCSADFITKLSTFYFHQTPPVYAD